MSIKVVIHFVKSSCKAAFLFLTCVLFGHSALAQSSAPSADALISIAIEKKLDQSAIWSALLHESHGVSRITDPDFILSAPHFNARRELQFTMAALFSGANQEAMRCKFPARDYWLRVELGLALQPIQACPDLVEYRSKAPFEEIRLVFASENVDQPSSMLGHVFLKMMGHDSIGELKQHAVTFYTDAETLNVPKLLWQNLTTGMPGFYSMVPFDDALRQYTEKENRSVWEYGLRLNEVSKELIGLHIFELKDVNFKYFFHRYNCANLIDDLLNIASPHQPPSNSLQWWTTPKDVIKRMEANGMLEVTEVTLATWWVLRSLERNFDPKQVALLKKFSEAPTEASWPRFEDPAIQILARELVLQYLYFLHKEGRLDESQLQARVKEVNRIAPGESYVLEVHKNANPINSQGDSQFSFGAIDRGGVQYVSLTYLPASHELLDASQGADSETELKLFQFTLLQEVNGRNLALDKLSLYSTQSKVSFDSVVGGSSGGVQIAYLNQVSPKLDYQPVFDVTLNRGWTTTLAHGTKAYIDFAGGLAIRDADIFAHLFPSVGLFTERIQGMKSHLSWSAHHNGLGHGGTVQRFSLGHRLQLTKDLSMQFQWERFSSTERGRVLTAAGIHVKFVY